MGTETRVGIVAGLVIVVIASVYFFYGHTPNEDELLVTTATRVSEQPKIPASAEEKDASSGRATADRSTSTRSRPPSQNVQGQPQRLADRLATGQRPFADRTRPAPQSDAEQTRGEPIVLADPSGAPDAERAAPQQPILLRTGPSSELVEATWDNLVGREETVADPQGTDYGTIGDRIRTAITPSDAEDAATMAPSDPTKMASPTAKDSTSLAPHIPIPLDEGSGTRRNTRAGVGESRRVDGRGLRLSSTDDDSRGPSSRPPIVTAPGRDLAAGSWPKQHVVVEGDTLEAISLQYYQRRTGVDEILAANPQVKSPRHLRIGDALTIPGSSQSASGDDVAIPAVRLAAMASPASARPGERTYVVVKGDTLYGIAQKELGNGGKWGEILQLNHALLNGDPKRLAPGMTLKLPD